MFQLYIKNLNMQIENFQKVKILGQGTYGRCYLVYDKVNNRNRVLKQIQIIGMSQEQVNQSIKQARILQTLQKHPFIVQFQSCFITNHGHLNIVMSYADGGDLSQKIKEFKSKDQTLSQNQILIWFTQICLAIKHVHDKKIIHRDIKAQNIFLTKSGNVKLGDFGIAKHLQHTIQKMKSIVGTPYYMSPEICENKQYTFKADIWSLGVILLEMCLLKPPFDANSLPVLALKISKGQYLPVPKYYSKQMKKLVHDLLMINPAQRPTITQILQYPIIEQRKAMINSKLHAQKQSPQPTLHEIHNFNKLPSRNLFLDCKIEDDSAIQHVISPTSQHSQLFNRNYDLPVKRIDNYMNNKEHQKVNVQKKVKKTQQLKKRQTSQPNITPKNHCKIQNQKKLIAKNNSLVNLQKKRSAKQKQTAFKKKNKISVQLQQIQQIKKYQQQIYNIQDQLIDPLKNKKIQQFKIIQEQIQDNSQKLSYKKDQEQILNKEQLSETLLQTLEDTISSYIKDITLEQMYQSCQENEGICQKGGPYRGLAILAYALKKQFQ